MGRIIVLDGGGCLHRAIFSYMNNPQVPSTYTYLRMLIGYLKRLEITLNDKIIIAQDYGKSWRKSIDFNYKATRKTIREEKRDATWWKKQYSSFDRLFEQLEVAMNWHFIKLWAIESDDIAAVCCRYYKDKEVLLISSDKDWEQLVYFKNVKIFSPITKKFKDIKNPLKILRDKIEKDLSDNLLESPSTEAEFEKRKKIVNLLELPFEIEQPIKEELGKLLPKNVNLARVPYKSIREEVRRLYGI